MRDRYGYIILAALSVLMGVVAVLSSLKQINDNNVKFCQLVVISNLHPVPKEPVSISDPVSERAWAMYSAYNNFGKNLGCDHIEPIRSP